MRADAKRNRELVLATAIEAFAAEGLAVSVHEIARRAGVGTGTVSRHFPTKASLYEAIIVTRMEQLITKAEELAKTEPSGTAFSAFFAHMVEQSAVDLGLADALSGAGFDVETAAAHTGYDIMGTLRDLLESAQAAGVIRDDIDAADVKALIHGCSVRERTRTNSEARNRTINVVLHGLQTR